MLNHDDMDRLVDRTLRASPAAPPTEACLPADTVAAWMDGTLTAVERAAAEAHAADCERCLALVAAVVRTTPATAPALCWWRPVRFLVPLTTAAAALVVWMVIRAPGPGPIVIPSSGDRPVDAAASSPASRPVESAPAAERDASPRTLADARQPPSTPAAPPLRDEQKIEARPRASAAIDAVRNPAAARPPASAAETIAPVPQLSPPADTASRPSAPPPAPAPTARADSMAGTVQLQRRAATVIQSPDARVRWRVDGASVSRSADGGVPWATQTTGVTGELLAGAAPSPSVCWIVGRGGVVLHSVDGVTWRRVDVPDPAAHLTAVAAADARTATVTAADGRRYRTVDGGRTWTLQENPAAPF